MLTSLNSNLIFEVVRHGNGGFSASCLNARLNDIDGRDIEELHDNLTALIDSSYAIESRPQASDIHLLLYQD